MVGYGDPKPWLMEACCSSNLLALSMVWSDLVPPERVCCTIIVSQIQPKDSFGSKFPSVGENECWLGLST